MKWSFMWLPDKNPQINLFLFNPIKMKNISINLSDDVFNETEKIIAKIDKNRNRYIREAVAFYNLLWKRRIISHQLQNESKIVQKESMRVLNGFENLHHAD